MSSSPTNLLCRYRYDPLDRLIGQAPPDNPVHQRFYCKSRLATEIQGTVQYSIIQQGDQLLAQQRRQGDVLDIGLLATDLQRSVLQTLAPHQPPNPIAYLPYGSRPAASGVTSLLGFNGEWADPVTAHYLLGNGYRAFNPVLMRFNSPDRLSPFGNGGLNTYTYCLGDPINLLDSDGKSAIPVMTVITHWRKFAAVKVAARAELQTVTRTNSIQDGLSRVTLKAGVTPQEAIAARNKAHKLDYLAGSERHINEKFMADLARAKREDILLTETFGASPGAAEHLKLLNYIKAGPMNKGSVISTQRLNDAISGQFDLRVPVHKRPNPAVAKAYNREIIAFMEASRGRYGSAHYEVEAMRIRSLNFNYD
jgi:RHS repeat-associated protein